MAITLSSDNFRRTYYAPCCSTTTLFCIFIYITILGLPFLLANYQKNIWRGNYEVFDPESEIQFKGGMYLVLGPNQSDNLNTFKTLKESNAGISSPSYEMSYNSIPTTSNDIRINIKVYQATKIATPNSEFIYLFFKYKSSKLKGLDFTDVIRLPINIDSGANHLTIYGNLFIDQKELYDYDKSSSYTFDSSTFFLSNFNSIFKTYDDRSTKVFNIGVKSNVYTKSIGLNGFEVDIILSRDLISIRTFPTISDLLRNTWGTYLAFFIPISIFFRLIFRESLRYKLFDTTSSLKLGDDEIYKVF